MKVKLKLKLWSFLIFFVVYFSESNGVGKQQSWSNIFREMFGGKKLSSSERRFLRGKLGSDKKVLTLQKYIDKIKIITVELRANAKAKKLAQDENNVKANELLKDIASILKDSIQTSTQSETKGLLDALPKETINNLFRYMEENRANLDTIFEEVDLPVAYRRRFQVALGKDIDWRNYRSYLDQSKLFHRGSAQSGGYDMLRSTYSDNLGSYITEWESYDNDYYRLMPLDMV